MNKLTSKLALIVLIVIGLVHFSSFAVASADAGALGGPTLEGAKVSLEKGPGGSIFTYEVIYTDNMVENWSVSLSWEVDNPEPAAGETITFSGYLRTSEENLGLAGKGLTLYKLLLDDNIEVSSSTTDENGYFTLLLDAPSSGIFCYRARFPGDNYYEMAESSKLYVNTLNKPLVFGVYAVGLFALVGVVMFLLSKGIAMAHYLKPVLLGFVLGFLLMQFGAGFIGLLAAGGIAGYLFARETPKWTKHLRIGCMTGFIFQLVVGLIIAYFLTWAPDALGLDYSVTQTEVYEILFSETISSLVNYVMMVGIGAVLGGMLRKLLKPGEQRLIGSGETTSSGVEQR